MESPPAMLARVLRGGRTESIHRGDVAVTDEEGTLVASAGDPDRQVYVRSAAKPFQAMPLLAAGGERAFRLDSDEIALLCASHGGEPRHVRVARRLLRRGRFGVDDLACGAHLPMHEPSARRLLSRGEPPTQLHNNCSGKHAGLLLACRRQGLDPSGYWRPRHPVQDQARERVAEFCGVSAAEIPIAIDGCSLPVFFLPLSALALAYARLVSRTDRYVSPSGRRARQRICRALWESPGMVAGLDRFTTDFLRVGREKWVGKEGAEGVYAIGVRGSSREKSIGIAFKIEDGSSRARDAVAVAILERLERLGPDPRRFLKSYRAPQIFSVRGEEVGAIAASFPANGIIRAREQA